MNPMTLCMSPCQKTKVYIEGDIVDTIQRLSFITANIRYVIVPKALHFSELYTAPGDASH